MGELMKFPGNFSGNPEAKQPIIKETGHEEDGNVSFIRGRKPQKSFSRTDIEEMLERLSERLSGGFDLGEIDKSVSRHDRRSRMEDSWWDAHTSGDLEKQSSIEVEIGGMFGIRRGGDIIDRLRTVAKIHDMQQNQQGNNLENGPKKEI